jgi:hypothetical protein
MREVKEQAQREAEGWADERCSLPVRKKSGVGGPKNIPPAAMESRLQLFLLFFSDIFKTSIIPRSQERAEEREKKRKAARKEEARKQQTSPARSHHKAINFTFSSLLSFLAISLIMGFAPLASEADYWKKGDDVWGNKFIRNVMSREEYHEMKKALRVNVEELIDHLNTKYNQYWDPFDDTSIDESLIPTKARCQHRVVIRRKPHPVGVKLWSLVDAAQFLYALSLFKRGDDIPSEKTEDTLARMASYLPEGRSFTIRADSYFGSVKAADKLDALGYHFTLACRKDRPSHVFGNYLHTRSITPNTSATIYRTSPTTNRTMAAITFNHKKTEGEKVVNFLSNIMAGEETVAKKNNTRLPDVAHDYNMQMVRSTYLFVYLSMLDLTQLSLGLCGSG